MRHPSARGTFWLVYLAVMLGIVGLLVFAPRTASAQTPRVVLKADTALLIVTLPKCTTACPDSVRITWALGGASEPNATTSVRRIARVVAPKTIDTVKVPRAQVGTRGVDFFSVAYKPSAAKHLKLWPADSVFEFYTSGGQRIGKEVSITAGDSIRALFVIVQPDRTRTRPTTPVAWTFGDALTLIRTNGLRDTIWLRAVQVAPPAPVAPSLTARFTVVCQPTRQCVVNASTSTTAGQPIVDYDWRWGDGRRVSANGPRTSVTYAAHGTYEVILVVSDAAGRRSTVTMSAVVPPQSVP